MGQDVRNDSRVCRIPPLLKSGRFNTNSDRREIIVAASLITVLSIATLSTYLLWVPPLGDDKEPVAEVPYGFITIDGDANFSATASLKGWPGDGSPENPYIIESLDIDLGGAPGNCISIGNTRVDFAIRNCNLTGASSDLFAAGIALYNVINGVLANNTCSNNSVGISLAWSQHNKVVNNTCANNSDCGICITGNIRIASNYGGLGWHNTVANNTCSNNGAGIYLY